MLNYIMRLLICAVAVYYAPKYLNQIQVKDFQTAFIVAFVMSILSFTVKPILTILTIPITIFTLGLFYLVILVAIVYICASFVNGFKVQGFIQPLIFSLALTVASWVASWFQD